MQRRAHCLKYKSEISQAYEDKYLPKSNVGIQPQRFWLLYQHIGKEKNEPEEY